MQRRCSHLEESVSASLSDKSARTHTHTRRHTHTSKHSDTRTSTDTHTYGQLKKKKMRGDNNRHTCMNSPVTAHLCSADCFSVCFEPLVCGYLSLLSCIINSFCDIYQKLC